MTIQTVIQIVLGHLPAIVGSGAGVWLLIEAAKKIKAIPLFQGQTVRLRAVAALLSALAAVALGLADGSLQGDNLKDVLLSLVGLIASAGGSWAVAHGAHLVTKIEPEK